MDKKTAPITVVIAGINGLMGRASASVIHQDKQLKLVAAYGRTGAAYTGKTIDELIGTLDKNGNAITIKSSLKECLSGLSDMPQVLLDFTKADSAVEHALEAIEKGIRPVIGTSGLTEDHFRKLKQAVSKTKIGALVVPNFSVGAMLKLLKHTN